MKCRLKIAHFHSRISGNILVSFLYHWKECKTLHIVMLELNMDYKARGTQTHTHTHTHTPQQTDFTDPVCQRSPPPSPPILPPPAILVAVTSEPRYSSPEMSSGAAYAGLPQQVDRRWSIPPCNIQEIQTV